MECLFIMGMIWILIIICNTVLGLGFEGFNLATNTPHKQLMKHYQDELRRLREDEIWWSFVLGQARRKGNMKGEIFSEDDCWKRLHRTRKEIARIQNAIEGLN